MTICSLQPEQVELIGDVIEQVWADVGAHYPADDPRSEALRHKLARIVLKIADREGATCSTLALEAAQAYRQMQSLRSAHRAALVGETRATLHIGLS